MEQGLVRKKDGKIEVITNEWDTFGIHDDDDMTLHHTSHRPRNGKKVWYVCRGVPTYKGPSQKIRAEKSAKFVYSTIKMSNRYDAQLNHKLKSYMEQSYVKYLHNNIDDEGDALGYNDLSISNSDENRETLTTKTSTSSTTSIRMATGSPPPPVTSTVYERLQIAISSGIDLNFDAVP
jgi:hypothetical protein